MSDGGSNILGHGRFYNPRTFVPYKGPGPTFIEYGLSAAAAVVFVGASLVAMHDIPTDREMKFTCDASTARIEGGPPANGTIHPQMIGFKVWTRYDSEGNPGRLRRSFHGLQLEEAIADTSKTICQGGPVTLQAAHKL